MVKKIGNIGLIIFWCISLCADSSISMQLLDNNGDPIRQVAMSVPFSIEVIVSSQQSAIATPEINGLKQFVVEDKAHISTINSIINGERTTKKIFRFVLRADKQGRYMVGPAHVMLENQRIESNRLTIVVGPQQITGSEQPCMRLLVDKDRVTIGEKISCSIRFYPGKSARLDGISEPTFPEFSTTQLDGPFTDSEVVDGINRNYVEWRTTLYPEKTGLLTIPALAAVCKIERKRRSHFDMFDRLFDGGLEQKQVFSNALTVKVDELPPYNGKVHGIGTFSQLKAGLDPAMAQEGEGVVLRLALEGEGNLDAVEPIELSLPDGLKYYESKQYIKDGRQSEKQRKIFEYIVQGIKPGSWVIPEQVFTYFDLGDHSYKQLKSNQLNLTITPLGKAHSITNTQKDALDWSSSKDTERDQLAPLQSGGQWHATQERTMSWIMLLFLLLLPLVFLGMRYAKYFIHQYRQKNAAYIYEKKAFILARKKLKKAQEYYDISNMYDIFVELIAHRHAIRTTQVSTEYIAQLLQESGWPGEVLEQWQSFFNELLQGKFGSTKYDIKQRTVLFDQAKYWLDELQKIL